MLRLYIIFLVFLMSMLLPALSEGQVISEPEVKIINNELYVSFSLSIEDKNIQEIKQGIDKELKFYIDMFRVWKMWPDEFVIGKYYLRTLKSDLIKNEFVATSNDGNVLIKKRFKSFESMLAWTLTVKDLRLTNIQELEQGLYFVKITAESKIRKLPPVIGYLFIFLSENEFKITKNSDFFNIEGAK